MTPPPNPQAEQLRRRTTPCAEACARTAGRPWASPSRGHRRQEPPAWLTGGRRDPAGSSAPPHRELRSRRELDNQARSHLLDMALPRSTIGHRESCQSVSSAERGRRGRAASAEGAWSRAGRGAGRGAEPGQQASMSRCRGGEEELWAYLTAFPSGSASFSCRLPPQTAFPASRPVPSWRPAVPASW